MIPEYTILTGLSIIMVVCLELFIMRTGLFRTLQFWLAMGLVFFFQIWVDGWLTKLSAPIVNYHPEEFSGIRFPWDIPIEDFGFGFSMVTLTLVVWKRLTDRQNSR